MKIFGMLVKKSMVFVTLMAIAGLTARAQATAINVGFGPSSFTPFVGTAAAADSGTTWNHVSVTSGTTGVLSDSQGGGTLVTLSISGGPSSHDVGLGTTVPLPTGHENLLRYQYYRGANATATILINNLNPTSTYTLYAYEVRGTDNENTTFTVTDNVGLQSLTSGLDLSSTTTLSGVGNEDYVVFAGLVPKLDGLIYQLQLDFTGFAENTSFGAINALQLVEVAAPEPTASLLLLGGIGSIVTLRRRFGKRLVGKASKPIDN